MVLLKKKRRSGESLEGEEKTIFSTRAEMEPREKNNKLVVVTDAQTKKNWVNRGTRSDENRGAMPKRGICVIGTRAIKSRASKSGKGRYNIL